MLCEVYSDKIYVAYTFLRIAVLNSDRRGRGD